MDPTADQTYSLFRRLGLPLTATFDDRRPDTLQTIQKLAESAVAPNQNPRDQIQLCAGLLRLSRYHAWDQERVTLVGAARLPLYQLLESPKTDPQVTDYLLRQYDNRGRPLPWKPLDAKPPIPFATSAFEYYRAPINPTSSPASGEVYEGIRRLVGSFERKHDWKRAENGELWIRNDETCEAFCDELRAAVRKVVSRHPDISSGDVVIATSEAMTSEKILQGLGVGFNCPQEVLSALCGYCDVARQKSGDKTRFLADVIGSAWAGTIMRWRSPSFFCENSKIENYSVFRELVKCSGVTFADLMEGFIYADAARKHDRRVMFSDPKFADLAQRPYLDTLARLYEGPNFADVGTHKFLLTCADDDPVLVLDYFRGIKNRPVLAHYGDELLEGAFYSIVDWSVDAIQAFVEAVEEMTGGGDDNIYNYDPEKALLKEWGIEEHGDRNFQTRFVTLTLLYSAAGLPESGFVELLRKTLNHYKQLPDWAKARPGCYFAQDEWVEAIQDHPKFPEHLKKQIARAFPI